MKLILRWKTWKENLFQFICIKDGRSACQSRAITKLWHGFGDGNKLIKLCTHFSGKSRLIFINLIKSPSSSSYPEISTGTTAQLINHRQFLSFSLLMTILFLICRPDLRVPFWEPINCSEWYQSTKMGLDKEIKLELPAGDVRGGLWKYMQIDLPSMTWLS